MKFKPAHFIAGAIIISAVALPMVSSAHSGRGVGSEQGKGNVHMAAFKDNMVIGTVNAISGTTLTVTDGKGTVYTIDASAAKIVPGGNAGLTVANILVGDKVVVTGPVAGTTETAKKISDSSMVGRNIFMGKVTAIDGSILTVESMAGKTKTVYQINTSAAAILKGMGAGTAITSADIKIDDRVFAIGTLSGTTVSATSVRDLGQFKTPKKPVMNWGKFKAGVHRGFGR